MYAVIKTGGKQYRVAVGDKLKVETLKVEAGSNIKLDHVLMVGDGDKVEVGTPTLDTPVEAKVLSHGRGKKLRIVKFRRRQKSRTRNGHRQGFTELEIISIGGKGAAKADKPKKDAKPAKAASESAAAKPKTGSKTASKDDLSRISGVGPVLVGKLEKLGVTTLQQVADFTDEDIARIDEELNFKGRIERDEWVKQAKQLLDE